MVTDKKYIGALDIGTSKVIALVGEIQHDNSIRIAGWGEAASLGLRAGMVADIDACANAIREAVDAAEHMACVRIDSVFTGIAGNHIRSINSQGVVKIQNGEVSQADIERSIAHAKDVNIPLDHDILHVEVQQYVIDKQIAIKTAPIGMSAAEVDTRVHIVTSAATALQNIRKSIGRCNLHDEKIVLQPLASGRAVLSDDEKELGVCVIDIGDGTTDIAVYVNGSIRHTAVIPIAGRLITNDLTQALRTPNTASEFIKTHYGAAHPDLPDLDGMVEVPSVGGDRNPRQVSRRVLANVIGARVEEIFEYVLNELHRANFSADMLGSGVVLTGGTSLLPGIVEVAEDIFGMPARIGLPEDMAGEFPQIRNPRYATVAGLLLDAKAKNVSESGKTAVSRSSGSAGGWWQKLRNFYENL